MANGGRSPHPNALRNYSNAEIPPEKLLRYALNPTHEARDASGHHGRDKAHVFSIVLGFDQSNWEVLAEGIIDELPFHEATSEAESKWGSVYRVDLPIVGMSGNIAKVRTVWLFRQESEHPTLITLWVLPRGK